ncbi:ATP-binding protein [soil metagenome]
MFKTLAGAVIATALMASSAFAEDAMPAGVKMENGAMADAKGKPLYTFVMDTMKGMSHCNDACAAKWPPLMAGKDAKPVGAWTLITRDDGSKQWAYKDKPLYTYASDKAGEAGTGETGGNWKLAK